MTDSPQAVAIGTRLGDGQRYEIRQRIGLGGMAEVYKAVDTRLGNRVVAIKTLSAAVAEHRFADKMRNLFIQEAQALSRVKDENVVDVLDFGISDDGTPYMVMEFLHGTDLGVFLKRTKQVPIEDAVDVMLGVCAGVHACHLAGIIHRDLKPANIFLSLTLKGEQTKVLDFSVAKVPIARAAGDGDQARTDLIVGTPSYMSPEQALGKPANELSDQYSIGALLYRCLTGRPPQGILPRPREMRPDIPESLERIILRALEPTPEKRFATVHELGHGLIEFASSAARGRWKPYYRTTPRPFDPASTAPISLEAARQIRSDAGVEAPSAPSAPATVAAPAYDFKAHERTTSLGPDGDRAKTDEAPTSTTSPTVDRVVAPDSPPTSGSSFPTSVDVPISDAVAGSHSEHAASVAQSGASLAKSSSLRGRRRLMLVFGILAMFVVAATLAGVRLGRDRQTSSSAPRPPEWTRSADTPSVPVVTPTVPDPPTPLRAVDSAPQNALPVPDRAEPAPAPVPPPERRPKRRRGPPPTTNSIQYGEDGLPILR